MGTVFEAEDMYLGHRVALKLLHADAIHRADALERFLREGRAAARIRHPHVIQVLSSGTERGVPYLAMELLQGSDLSELVARRGRLPVQEALDLLLPAFAGVCAAHDASVIHRDLKPANIFVARGPSGEALPKVLDFGVSKVIGDEPSSSTEAVIGTVAYMAPEQARCAGNASFASDQYSLALLLYHCITGELPFEGRSVLEIVEAVMTAPPMPPSQRRAEIPRAIDAPILRAMSRAPSERFASVRHFGAALIEFASGCSRLEFAAELVPSSRTMARPVPASASIAPPEGTLRGDTLRSTAQPRDVAVGALDVAPISESGLPPSRASSGFLSNERELGPAIEANVATFDGLAAVVRGDLMAMVWKSSARAPRTRWAFDIIHRLAARQPRGIVVLMIILPSAAPPDREARIENELGLRRLGSSLRAVSTVVVGDGVFQTLLRSVIRAMMLPHVHRISAASTIESTIDEGIARLRMHAGPATPLPAVILDDVRAMFGALDLDPPGWSEAQRKSA
jgi:serine/threonine-protein kinase